jgi:hypothetical protein
MDSLVGSIAPDTLGGEDEGVVDGLGKERSKEVVGRLDRSCVGMRGVDPVARDAEISKADGEMGDLDLLLAPVLSVNH